MSDRARPVDGAPAASGPTVAIAPPPRQIPWTSLTAQHAALRGEILAAVGRILDSGSFVAGREVAAFESAFAAHEGTRHALALANGTVALEAALAAVGVGPGDEVLTPPNSFFATTGAILRRGARPVYVDADAATYTIDAAKLAAALTPRTRAVIPVHLYGLPAAMPAIRSFADAHRLAVIGDAAQAHGATIDGRPHTAWADVTAYSFYPTKNLGTVGEGGAVLTDRDDVAERVRLYRDHGQGAKNRHDAAGTNYRMSEIQAAVLAIKLPHLDAWIAARRERAGRYDALLAGAPHVTTPSVPGGYRHVYHLYVIRHPRRDALARALQARGIATSVHYPGANHLQPAVADLGYEPGSFPIAERLVNEILTLPLFPELPLADVEYVAAAVQEEAVGAAREEGAR